MFVRLVGLSLIRVKKKPCRARDMHTDAKFTYCWVPLKTHDFRADDASNRDRVLVAPIF